MRQNKIYKSPYVYRTLLVIFIPKINIDSSTYFIIF